MATSYLSTQVNPHVEVIGLQMGQVTETFSITFAANTFASGDTIALAQIPLFCSVLDFYLSISASLGTSNSFSIGTTTTPAQFVSTQSYVAASVSSYANGLTGFAATSLPTAKFTTQTVASIPAGITLDPSGNVADYLLMTSTATAGAATSATIKGYIRYTLAQVS